MFRRATTSAVVLLLAIGCVDANAPRPQQYGFSPAPQVGMPPQQAMVARVIRADAPEGFSVQHLGAPLDANFQPLIGGGAVSMFPQSGSPSVTPMNEMHVDTSLVRSTGELKANARAWFVNAGVSTTTDRRHALFRVVQITSVHELHDNTLMAQPPPGAVYYPWRIYMGHSYWEVVEGDSHTFSGKIGAEFLHWGASISDFKGKYHLESHAGGRGLVPKTGAAIFARSPQEIQANYGATGPDVPIVARRKT